MHILNASSNISFEDAQPNFACLVVNKFGFTFTNVTDTQG